MSVAAESGYRPYPDYKDSGVEWLGKVPKHWDLQPLRSFARAGYKTFTDGDWIESPYIRDEGIRLIQTGNIGIGFYKEQGFRFIDEETFESLRCTEVFPGDVLVCRLADPVGRACLAPDLKVRMITSVDVCILKTREDIDPSFVVYLLSSTRYLSWLSTISRGGTRDRISRSMLGSLRLQLPPLPEQRAITAFLDHKTAEIDALIAAKERLIALLREKRAALITQAVTKGLDMEVPMKDSGVEWLGEVPGHWEIRRAKYVFQRVQRPVREEDEVVTAFRDGTVTLRSNRRTEGFTFSIQEIGYQGIRKGDLVVHAMDGFAGAIGVSDSDGKATPVYTVLRPLNEGPVNNNYYGYLLRNLALSGFVNALAKGIRERSTEFRYNEIKELWLPLLPYAEQTQVVNFVEREKEKLESLVSTIQQAIDYLKEYRTALISAAVTGKIDVRLSQKG